MISEMRADSHFPAVEAGEAWRREAGAPRALRRALRRARHWEKLEHEGVDVGADGRRLLRRIPRLQAALAMAVRPAAGISPESPPRAAVRPRDFEGDVVEFRRRMQKEFSSLMDFHLRPDGGGAPRQASADDTDQFAKLLAVVETLGKEVKGLHKLGAQIADLASETRRERTALDVRVRQQVREVLHNSGPQPSRGRIEEETLERLASDLEET